MTKLQQFRIEQGVSRPWLAKRLGIHPMTLARYEKGETQPPKSFYYQLAHVFRFPIEQVLPLDEHGEVQ